MKIYRLQIRTGVDLTVEWFPTKQQAVQTSRAIIKQADLDPHQAHLDCVEVCGDRAGIATALNNAATDRTQWPGEPVKL